MSSDHSKKIFDEYYLGLDIGTDSVGWCVTDPAYNILKFNGKAMWGIRLLMRRILRQSEGVFAVRGDVSIEDNRE